MGNYTKDSLLHEDHYIFLGHLIVSNLCSILWFQ